MTVIFKPGDKVRHGFSVDPDNECAVVVEAPTANVPDYGVDADRVVWIVKRSNNGEAAWTTSDCLRLDGAPRCGHHEMEPLKYVARPHPETGEPWGYRCKRCFPEAFDPPPVLATFAVAWTIPTSVATLQDRPCKIGGNPYGRRDLPGVYVSKVYDELTAICLRHDGTWDKYGEAFATPQVAYETLLATTHVRWGD